MSKLQVMAKQCDQCLFSKQKIVSNARKAQLIRDCQRQDTHFICHKTTEVVCRGFFDCYTSQLIRIAGRLNMLEFVDAPKETK